MKVLITGATRGIGLATSKYFYEKSHEVIGIATQKTCATYLHSYISANFNNKEDVDRVCNLICNYEIDVLINNAGINIVNSFLQISHDEWIKQHSVNVYAPFRLSQAVLPNMIKKRKGSIINIASVWSHKSKIGRASYSANKCALEGMTRSMAAEFAEHGINVNCISPGFIDTDLTRKNLNQKQINTIIKTIPAKRLGAPEEIADMIYKIVGSPYINGQNIFIDGGFTRV